MVYLIKPLGVIVVTITVFKAIKVVGFVKTVADGIVGISGLTM